MLQWSGSFLGYRGRLRTTKVGFWQAWSAGDKLGIVIATEIG